MATTSLFTLNKIGPPPGTLTVGSELWVDLGLITSGKRVWFGSTQYSSPNKSITFELRTNLATKSTGSLANTSLLNAVAVSPKSGTLITDLYKKGTLHITSVYGTGVEQIGRAHV